MSETAADVLAGRARYAVDVAEAEAWLRALPADSVHCWVTSPPYFGLRSYLPKDHPQKGWEVGLEDTPRRYVERVVWVMREARRALHPTGVMFLNVGDSYAASGRGGGGGSFQDGDLGTCIGRENQRRRPVSGLKPKDLIGIPWLLALALRDDGWYLRADIIWSKPAPMPESVRDRPTRSHEYVFLLTKGARYFYDALAVAESATSSPHAPANNKLDASRNDHDRTGVVWAADGRRNRRSVWTINTKPFKGAHFAVMPPRLAELCVLAGTSAKGCCPACGAPWVPVVGRGRKPTRPGRDTKLPMTEKNAFREATGMQSRRSTLKSIAAHRDPQRHVTTFTHAGWRPGCKCPDNGPASCVVGDMFAGAGTTGVAAHGHGRRFVGCDLSERFQKMALRRISHVTPTLDGLA